MQIGRLLAFGLVFVAGITLASPPQYTLQIINQPVVSISESGTALVTANSLVTWNNGVAQYTPLGFTATDVNDQGRAVGYTTTTEYWNGNLGQPYPVNIGHVFYDGADETRPDAKLVAINNAGTVAGTVVTSRWIVAGSIQESRSIATGVDSNGNLLRSRPGSSDPIPPHTWIPAATYVAIKVGGATVLSGSDGVAMSSGGRVYLADGSMVTPLDSNDDGAPDIWFQDANADGVNDLATSAPSGYKDLNDLGQLVGGTYGALLWQAGVGYNLSSLVTNLDGWNLTAASRTNNLGQIVGTATKDGATRGFLLTPIPEPATMSLLALGGLATIRRLRQN